MENKDKQYPHSIYYYWSIHTINAGAIRAVLMAASLLASGYLAYVNATIYQQDSQHFSAWLITPYALYLGNLASLLSTSLPNYSSMMAISANTLVNFRCLLPLFFNMFYALDANTTKRYCPPCRHIFAVPTTLGQFLNKQSLNILFLSLLGALPNICLGSENPLIQGSASKMAAIVMVSTALNWVGSAEISALSFPSKATDRPSADIKLSLGKIILQAINFIVMLGLWHNTARDTSNYLERNIAASYLFFFASTALLLMNLVPQIGKALNAYTSSVDRQKSCAHKLAVLACGIGTPTLIFLSLYNPARNRLSAYLAFVPFYFFTVSFTNAAYDTGKKAIQFIGRSDRARLLPPHLKPLLFYKKWAVPIALVFSAITTILFLSNTATTQGLVARAYQDIFNFDSTETVIIPILSSIQAFYVNMIPSIQMLFYVIKFIGNSCSSKIREENARHDQGRPTNNGGYESLDDTQDRPHQATGKSCLENLCCI